MNFENITELLTQFILSGGLSYLNYYILMYLSVINAEHDNENKTDSVYAKVFLTLLNVFLFYGISLIPFFKENIYAILGTTLFLSMFFSFTLYLWIIKFLHWIINQYRLKVLHLSEISDKNIKQINFDKNKHMFLYMYDLRTHELLVYGGLKDYDYASGTDLEFGLVPLNEEYRLFYEKAIERATDKKNIDESFIFVNTSKNVKIVILPVEEKDNDSN